MSVKVIFIIFNLVSLISALQNRLALQQVVILNRHSIRTPLSDNVNEVSPRAWPKWDAKPGSLTAKGATLAGYMGSYFAAWLKKEGILPSSCPTEDDLFVVSNAIERTLTSAKSFVEKGFPDCTINVHHNGYNASNPIFNPIIHNTTTTFREQALKEMQEVLNNFHLNQAYELLSNILDYKQSRFCEFDGKCNLANGKHRVSITPGLKPQLDGPIKISKEIVDNFLMQYYEGFPTENVAWGKLTDENSWQTIFDLNSAYFDVTYKTRPVAKDISKPLIKYMSNILLKDDNKPKVTLLVGHDVNFHTVFKTLAVRPYCLQKQDEIIPIGSAVVFQKWRDTESKTDYLKTTYVYQSTEQLRDCTSLSLKSPPLFKNLELEDCKVDIDGFCLWDDFKTFLTSEEYVDTLVLSDQESL